MTGATSELFWAAAEPIVAERRRAYLRQRGHTEADAPAALVDAADGAAQAVLLRDSAFLHIVKSGGPTTLRDRRRTAFAVWREAGDRALRYLSLVGIEQRDVPAMSIADTIAAMTTATTPTALADSSTNPTEDRP